MHILQYMAVKAETVDEAYDLVDSKLEDILNNQSPWFDWYVVGGGRFNVAEGEDWQEAYKNGKTNLIISSEERGVFDEKIDTLIKYRLDEFNRYRDTWSESGVTLSEYLDGYDGDMNFEASYHLYDLAKMIDMIEGNWIYTSYFYDLENWTTTPKYMQSDINDVGGVWYLVPVDFHF